MQKIVVLVSLLIMTGCSSGPNIVQHPYAYSGLGANEVYVVSHGWHTGFVVPSKRVYTIMPGLKSRFGDTPRIEFGWGDQGFYQARQITSGLTLKAIFWPTQSVMHAVSVPRDVHAYFPNSKKIQICLTHKELDSLLRFIHNSFEKNDRGEVISLGGGIYGDAQFYKGVGDYYLMNTCNKWTAKGLKSIGMDISPGFKLSASSIMRFLNKVDSTLTKPHNKAHNSQSFSCSNR